LISAAPAGAADKRFPAAGSRRAATRANYSLIISASGFGSCVDEQSFRTPFFTTAKATRFCSLAQAALSTLFDANTRRI